MPQQAPPVCAIGRGETVLHSHDAGAPRADQQEDGGKEQGADREEENQKGQDRRGEQGQSMNRLPLTMTIGEPPSPHL